MLWLFSPRIFYESLILLPTCKTQIPYATNLLQGTSAAAVRFYGNGIPMREHRSKLSEVRIARLQNQERGTGASLGGELRKMNERLVRHGLVPTDTASVHREGICFRGHYVGHFALDDQFDQPMAKRSPVTFSYDKRHIDEIYVHIKGCPSRFQIVTLTPPCGEKAGMDDHEIGTMMRSDVRSRAASRSCDTPRGHRARPGHI